MLDGERWEVCWKDSSSFKYGHSSPVVVVGPAFMKNELTKHVQVKVLGLSKHHSQ